MSIYNTTLPISHELHMPEHQRLRSADSERDKSYSPIHDTILNNICHYLNLYGDSYCFGKLWTSSMFPERLTKAIMRAMEEHIDILQNPTPHDTPGN